MENIQLEVKENFLIITMDLGVDLGPSSTGGSNFVAKTGGWQRLQLPQLEGRDLRLNLNLTDVPPRGERSTKARGSREREGWREFDWRKQMEVD